MATRTVVESGTNEKSRRSYLDGVGRLFADEVDYVGIAAGKDEGLVPVVPAHDVTLRAVVTVDLEDLALPLRATRRRALHDDLVAGLCMHWEPPFVGRGQVLLSCSKRRMRRCLTRNQGDKGPSERDLRLYGVSRPDPYREVMIFACVVAHELAHSIVARRRGGIVTEILLLPIGGISKVERLPESPSDVVSAEALEGAPPDVVVAAVTDTDAPVLAPEASLEHDALPALEESQREALAVVRAGRVVGLLRGNDLARLIALRTAA